MGCMMCGKPVEYPEFTDLCNACDDANLAYAQAVVPCCGRHREYCECPPFKRDYALVLAAAERDCPPAPRMAPDDPRRDDEPPF